MKSPDSNYGPVGKTIKAGTHSLPQVVKKEKNLTTATKCAGDNFVKINWYHSLLKEAFPLRPKMWTIDKYYPRAKGGDLFVDEPRLAYKVRECEEKQAVFEKHGVRYLILKDGVHKLNDVEGLAE